MITLAHEAMADRAKLPGLSSSGAVRLDVTPQRRLAYEDQTALVLAYVAGANMKDLAAAHGIHRVTVSEIIRRAGVSTRRRGLDPGQVERALRLYREGWSLARLGQRFEVDGTTVWRALRGRGVVMRPPHEQPKDSKTK
jgi:transposase-like protein